jgi:putative transposase
LRLENTLIQKIDNPRHLNNSLKRLKVLQRRLSKKKKGSNNRLKAKYKVALLSEKIANQRKDFLHKLSTRLVSENQAICLEDLNVSGMIRNHCLALHIQDCGWSECGF